MLADLSNIKERQMSSPHITWRCLLSALLHLWKAKATGYTACNIHHTTTAANTTYLASNQVAKEDELLRDRQHQRSQGGDVGLEGMASNGHELLRQVHPHPPLRVLPLVHTTIPARQCSCGVHASGQRLVFDQTSLRVVHQPASVRTTNDVSNELCTAACKTTLVVSCAQQLFSLMHDLETMQNWIVTAETQS